MKTVYARAFAVLGVCAFSLLAAGCAGSTSPVPKKSIALSSTATAAGGHTRATRGSCGPNTSPTCSEFVTCDPNTDPQCIGTNPDGTYCELTTCGQLDLGPGCSFASDPQCTGIDINGNPCDPYLATCGPGGDPFGRIDPGARLAAQIALHQPQCMDLYGPQRTAYHQCYVIARWVN